MQPTSSTKPTTPVKADDGHAAGDTSASEKPASEIPVGAKILPPNSPVDVPRMPAPAPQPAEVPDLSDPRGNTTSWADSPEADPHKKTARTSINNG